MCFSVGTPPPPNMVVFLLGFPSKATKKNGVPRKLIFQVPSRCLLLTKLGASMAPFAFCVGGDNGTPKAEPKKFLRSLSSWRSVGIAGAPVDSKGLHTGRLGRSALRAQPFPHSHRWNRWNLRPCASRFGRISSGERPLLRCSRVGMGVKPPAE